LVDTPNAEPDEFSAKSAYAEAAGQFASDMSVLSIPGWCQDYLGTAAKKLWKFSDRENRENASQLWIKKIPRDLGFTRRGWNAFSEYFSHVKTRRVRRNYDSLVEAGNSASEARKMLLEKYGFADERSLYRKFQNAKRLMEAKPSAQVTKPKA
jgi:hypothetical protein